MFCRANSPAAKRYRRRVMIALTFYVAALYLSEYVLQRFHPGTVLTVAVAALPSVPILGVLAVIGLYLREERDEFQRDLTMQTLVWGMGGALAVATTYGFVEQFAHAPHFAGYWVFVMFWFFTGIARMVYWLRFREPRDDK